MSSPTVDISVIIPSYDRPEQLKRCLAGFHFLQAPSFRYEIVVVDDGSSNPLKPLLAPQFDALPICWLRQDNLGPATARNYGASIAQGQFIAFIDDDCLPHASWLVTLWDILSNQSTALVGGHTLNGLPDNLYAEASQLLVSYLYRYFEGKNGRFFTSNNFALSRQLFMQLGGFDESMPLAAGEDREFCARWQDAGLLLVYEPAAKVHHYHHLAASTFWQQHVNYGRGAKLFRYLRRNKNAGPIKIEPLSFYVNLLLVPLNEKRPFSWKNLFLIGLMALSQLANALGYFLER
ncbi:MAG: glycosyltransferase [Chloroflexota bacterium]